MNTNASIDISNNENKQFNNLTLKYFSNKSYTNSINTCINNTTNTKGNLKEIKFYRKRIMDFTKKMLRDEIDLNNINSNIKLSYYDYVNTLIENFKINDKNDLIQEEFNNNIYDDKNTNTDNIKNDINELDLENINNIILKKSKSISTIDDFVLKKNNKKEIQIYPQEKKINLKSKDLRVKGLKKNNK